MPYIDEVAFRTLRPGPAEGLVDAVGHGFLHEGIGFTPVRLHASLMRRAPFGSADQAACRANCRFGRAKLALLSASRGLGNHLEYLDEEWVAENGSGGGHCCGVCCQARF